MSRIRFFRRVKPDNAENQSERGNNAKKESQIKRNERKNESCNRKTVRLFCRRGRLNVRVYRRKIRSRSAKRTKFHFVVYLFTAISAKHNYFLLTIKIIIRFVGLVKCFAKNGEKVTPSRRGKRFSADKPLFLVSRLRVKEVAIRISSG